jgi:hypothetical protein
MDEQFPGDLYKFMRIESNAHRGLHNIEIEDIPRSVLFAGGRKGNQTIFQSRRKGIRPFDVSDDARREP